MKTIAVDGYKFVGPYIMDKDELPAVAGIMLISTEAGEGIKFMCIEESDDMASFIADSDRKEIWIKNAYHGQVDIYIMCTDCNYSERASIVESLVRRREAYLSCQRQKIIEDDW
jgi:hypothetical protein